MELVEVNAVGPQAAQAVLGPLPYIYEVLGKSPSKFGQQAAFPKWKKSHSELSELSELSEVFSQVLQNVAVRVDLAFRSFFRRVKQGETPGYPRVKGHGQYDSITYPQAGFGIVQGRL